MTVRLAHLVKNGSVPSDLLLSFLKEVTDRSYAILKVMIKEFLVFLKEYDIITLAVAFVMGTASTDLVNSLVKNLFLPLATPLTAAETFDKAAFSIGVVTISYGAVVAEILNFLILALLIFFIVRAIPKKIKK